MTYQKIIVKILLGNIHFFFLYINQLDIIPAHKPIVPPTIVPTGPKVEPIAAPYKTKQYSAAKPTPAPTTAVPAVNKNFLYFT